MWFLVKIGSASELERTFYHEIDVIFGFYLILQRILRVWFRVRRGTASEHEIALYNEIETKFG